MMSEPSSRATADVVGRIYAISEFNGAPIGFYTGMQSIALSPGNNMTLASGVQVIIIEPLPNSAAPASGSGKGEPKILEGPDAERALKKNGSRVGPELLGAGLSCGFAVVSGVAVLGGGLAAPASGGASTLVTVAAWTGFVTGSAQCLNGVYRGYQTLVNPDSTSLAELDEDPYYKWTTFAVDAVGVLSGLPGLYKSSASLVRALRAKHGLPAEAALKAMNRAQRQQAINDALRRAAGDKEVEKLLFEAAAEARQGMSSASRKGANAMRRVISEHAMKSLNGAMKDLAMSLSQIAINAMPGEWVGSASGSVNTVGGWVVNVIVAE
jgi:hypothetical protein